ncbi:MAG: superoxide dismutase family protein [Planctomycetota bacterium]|nr:MAG: superoxide dismutase family protein [Planctomycetota bacterium]
MKTARFVVPALALAGGLLLLSCKNQPASAQDSRPAEHHPEHVNAWKAVTKAVCVIQPTQGNEAHGIVRFEQMGEQVKITADIEGLKPGSKHGFHIHQWGDVSDPKGKATGGHYNPEGHAHAGPGKGMRHAGDLGNIVADAQGKAHLELTVDNISVAGLKNPIVGRGMIVHAGEDDLKSQPTGAAGARIGQGVIGIAKP